jgi:hypothetical protein
MLNPWLPRTAYTKVEDVYLYAVAGRRICFAFLLIHHNLYIFNAFSSASTPSLEPSIKMLGIIIFCHDRGYLVEVRDLQISHTNCRLILIRLPISV